eukprot:CAMPEP_0179329698 /NCGR_PEP_ID=MMETSP0797-20121207/63267_1 /TAXON_ID=47934 /ORGANISM="Dinophysis acuminata, Strain DAEP01" /LENGTH=250 /DNA_ID=CAMNT_0021042373 /DNA_START=8 /DNA_END=757 /DNA_ORIENTATION=+
MVEYVIRPITKPRGCSYVEFIADVPSQQIPEWFVSHWWGEQLERFAACMDLFHERHSLTKRTPFWVCAYALRQNQLASEIGIADPMQEPFAKAITLDTVKGTIAILDENLITYKRAWCCFEAMLAIKLTKRLDLVIALPTGTHMIADGPAGGDKSVAAQEKHDQQFPLHVLEEGMNLTIELSTTTQPCDKNRILNCIARDTVSTEAPPILHENYTYYNGELRNKFVAVFLRVATANGDADGVRRALHQCL